MQFLFLGIGELPLWQQAIRGIGILICRFIYWLISALFQLFMTISRVNILSSDEIAPIYQRVTMILTIIMVFYITFEFVKYVVQPDTISDKEKGVGNLGLKIIVVILLIAFVPKIFSLGYQLQNKIIENQLISKVILGKKNSDFENFGGAFSANVFSLFYTVDEETCEDQCNAAQALINKNLEKLRTEGTTKYLDDGINEANKVTIDGETKQRPIIDFNGFMAILVGAFIVYMLLLYCIDVGTRYAQLIFLQIISPIAIMGYLTPKKDNTFSKWVKQCITTYLNLFIRIAIIYFVILLCQVLSDAYPDRLFEGLGEISTGMKMLTYVALIMGLLLFANKAPKMLQELFPSSGAAGIGFGPRTPSQVVKDAPLLGRAIGAAYAGGGSMLKNTRKSFGKALEELKKGEGHRLKALKWLGRGTFGNVGAGLSGIGLGLGSTDPSGWQRAMKNSYDRRQAKYKVHDAGYKPLGKGASKWWSDQARNILLMDEHIEDITQASDLRVQSLQQRMSAIQQSGKLIDGYTVSKSKATGEYILYNKDGDEVTRGDRDHILNTGITETKERINDKGETEYYPVTLEENIKLADLNSQLGKEQGKNKALHQKENESKDKK